MAVLLSVSQFNAGVSGQNLVDHLDFELSEGQILGIAGESGSGKSVTCMGLTRLLSDKIEVTGSVKYCDAQQQTIDLLTCSDKQLRAIRGKEIAYIFQEPMTALNPVLTCGLQVAEAIRVHNPQYSAKQRKQKVLELFEEVKLPDPERIFHSYPHQISGGQRQRVMIGMALANNPRLLIADEPTTALDATVQKHIVNLLAETVSRRGMAMIFISHDLGCLHSVADHILIMYRGKRVESGTAETLFNRPSHPYTRALLKTRPRHKMAGYKLPTIQDLLVEQSDGTFGEKEFVPEKRNTAAAGEALLTVKQLSKSYARKGLFSTKPSKPVLNDIHFQVLKGKTLGIVGESGCGKSTLARILVGLETHFKGEILFGPDGSARRTGQTIQMVFQDPFSSLNPSIKAGAAIMEPLLVHRMVSPAQAREKALNLLSMCGLDHTFYHKYPYQMSGGQRQRLCIARALTTEPSVLILDEAVAALDVSVQSQILNLLKDLQVKLGLTYLFISHDLNVVGYISDTIMVIKDGKIEELGDARTLIEQPASAYTRYLIDSMYD